MSLNDESAAHTSILGSTQSLQAYRMVLTSSSYWLESEEIRAMGGVDALDLFQAPHSNRDAFLEWWNGEKERAISDRVILLVVGGYYDHQCHKEWLQIIEEEEWFDGEEIRFTTITNLLVAIGYGKSLNDCWGDIIIEKVTFDGPGGVSASDDEESLD
ncbi:hypothetical protein ACHAXA_004136 [Cyclostephanos tholiformis]|jgi:hypothetical protein|uniref:Uncharacterized protein n=1 Tax=Cyclostephanos tholiformis TaxID=382380 RepID=A0ABD3SH08_9STRA